MNILYASTHGWNIGDDFIRMGCERLMEELFPGHNRLLYDKSPHVRSGLGDVWEKDDGQFHGNSAGYVKHRNLKIDLLVGAGTPGNDGPVMGHFFDWDAPAIGLALGGLPQALNGHIVDCWRRCRVLTVRSQHLLEPYRKLFGGHVRYLPCTSLFWTDDTRTVSCLHRVALGWKCAEGHSVTNNVMTVEQHDRMLALYRELMKARPELEYFIACHHIDELMDAQRTLPELESRCCHDEHLYNKVYGDADFVITPKVHGCGCCAAMGIPGVLLPMDHRAGTADGFLSPRTWEPGEILREMDVCRQRSDMLLWHKDKAWDAYMRLLREWKERL